MACSEDYMKIMLKANFWVLIYAAPKLTQDAWFNQ